MMTDLQTMSAGPQAEATPATGCYREVSPHEFNGRKELVVAVLKAEDAVGSFEGFSEVICFASAQELEAHFNGHSSGHSIGLVCPNGDCSGRLAIRLSRRGHTVVHLAGGLQEWYRCFPR